MHPELVAMIQAIREAADAEERPAFSEEAAKKAKIPRSVLGLLKPLALKATKHGFAISCAPNGQTVLHSNLLMDSVRWKPASKNA